MECRGMHPPGWRREKMTHGPAHTGNFVTWLEVSGWAHSSRECWKALSHLCTPVRLSAEQTNPFVLEEPVGHLHPVAIISLSCFQPERASCCPCSWEGVVLSAFAMV